MFDVANKRGADHVVRLIDDRRLSLGRLIAVSTYTAFFSSRSIRIWTRIGKSWLLARKPGALGECHADPLFCAPDDMTGLVDPVCDEHQREMCGDANRAADVQGRPDIRHIANHAVDSAAVELDRCGLQHAVPCGGPFLRHEAGYFEGLKN